MNLYSTLEFRSCIDLFRAYCSQIVPSQAKCVMPALNSKWKYEKLAAAELGHFTLLFAEDGKEMYKIHNPRAQPLVSSLNLLFGGVLLAIAVVVCLLRSLLSRWRRWRLDVDCYISLISIIEQD